MRRADPYETRAREMAVAAGLDPDARVMRPDGIKEWPAWCSFRKTAREEHVEAEAKALGSTIAPQAPEYANAPLTILGEHEPGTIEQMKNCMQVGNVVAGVLCADGHLGYAQPVGGVIAYEGQISISGVGFDIACGTMAVRLDTPYAAIRDRVPEITREIARSVSFGIGRVNDERVGHDLFDDAEAWKAADMEGFHQKARAQLGTCGSGNHYIDLMEDEGGHVWLGLHFGSRGLGHTSATKYLKAAGGKDGINVPPTVVDVNSEIGERYLAAMTLSGRYAYAGREWVMEKVRSIVGGSVLDTVHNHHNFAWSETTPQGRKVWVVRKGATPAAPGERGFVGGSMGDDAVILAGVESPDAAAGLYSTVHGAGRVFGRKEAKRRFSRQEMEHWLRLRGVFLLGADLDESPMAYRRLPEVLAHHSASVQIQNRLRPFAVVMAGGGETDPYKD